MLTYFFHLLRARAKSPSWQLRSAAFGFIVGTVLGMWSVSLLWLLFATLALIFAVIVSRRGYPSLFLFFLFLSFVSTGFTYRVVRYDALQGTPLVQVAGRVVTVEGVVMDNPRPAGKSVRYEIQPERLEGQLLPRHPLLTIIARPFPEFTSGQTVRAICNMTLGSDGLPLCLFPTMEVLPVSLERNGLHDVRDMFLQSISSVYPEPEAGFIGGLLVGGSDHLTEHWRERLRASGTAHLVALSGYNVSVISSALLFVLSLLLVPRRWRFFIIATTLALFVAMVGGGASIVRAVVMGLLVALARHWGRSSAFAGTILVAAVLMLVQDPTLVTDDLGFQLSFLATLAMVTVAPMVEERLEWLPEFFGMREALALALAAELVVTPLLLLHFGQLSLVAPLTNALVAPAIPFIMFFGFLGGVAGFLAPAFGQFLGVVGWLGARYVLDTIAFAASLPMAAVPLHLPVAIVALYYACLGFCYWKFHRKMVE